jgi:hypothetical protein
VFVEMPLYLFSPNKKFEDGILKKIEKQKFDGCSHN